MDIPHFMQLSFLGATDTVTGSKYLLEVDNKKILIDCGLFQGLKSLRLLNWAKLPIHPKQLDAVLITHAHLDHTGYLPLLVKNGFKGPIYATQGTIDLCKILLPDSGHIQEEDAARANKYHYTKHPTALPLYTEEDAQRALKQFEPIPFNQAFALTANTSITWHDAGHILGAAWLHIQTPTTSLVFSGDLGRPNDPLMKAPEPICQADYLVLESTYGGHLHEKTDPAEQIAHIIHETTKRGGSIIIPAFAVGRAQSMLYYLYQLKRNNQIPNLPIFLDSPMAIDATRLLMMHRDELRINSALCKEICHVATYINTPDESKEIDRNLMPKIILSASGMITGGRILHHLKVYGPDPKNTILLTGFQAAGTRGARIQAGESTIKIHGQMIPIRAQIQLLTNTSAHADYEESIAWISQMHTPPKRVFLTHGEPASTLALKAHIQQALGWTCTIPHYQDSVILK